MQGIVAYIGPGAGFAVVGSFFLLFAALLLSGITLVTWPVQMGIALRRRARRSSKPLAKRVVVLGLDALDPRHVRTLMREGQLPNFARLADTGTFSELGTTCPPVSPVAWSSFMTGTNPGKHNIFDFVNRNLETYALELSSSQILANGHRRHQVRALRRSRPFWHLLGECGIPTTVLRVPITFPPEPFHGRCLSGMCVPDLRGTQGEFTVLETHPSNRSAPGATGCRIPVTVLNGIIRANVPGPRIGDATLDMPIEIHLRADNASAELRMSGQRITLVPGTFSPWIRLTFRKSFTRVRGICKVLLVSIHPEFRLYLSPLNLDPAEPALPISHPPAYAPYLEKLHGPFATLGIAEDTSALNAGVLTEDQYRTMVYDVHGELERMFVDALQRTRVGMCACVFDTPDRIQHIFWREGDNRQLAPSPARAVIDDLYRRMDQLVGRVLDTLDRDSVLLVLSDHGFGAFRRSVNLNAWLVDNGYLVLKPEPSGRDGLRDVDWTRSRAYALGLAGCFLNIKGRERLGIVPPEQAAALKAEIASKLGALRDPVTQREAVRTVYDSATVYHGPYVENAPDLVVGYANGYRASWEHAVGHTDGAIFADNTKPWCADHIMDRTLVPGVIFCNRTLEATQRPWHITDLAPTILNLFGIQPPEYMDGIARVPMQTRVPS